MSLVGLIVVLVVILIVMVMAKYIVEYMEVPPTFRWIVLLVVGLLCLILLLNQLGVAGRPMVIW